MTVWVTSDRVSPALAHSSPARLASSSTRLRPPEACDRADDRTRTSPARSVSAPRTYCAPTSRPSTNPASGLISYSSADLPGRPMRWPASRIRPACSTVARARETVGLDRPDSRARSAREQGPRSRMCPSSSCSLSARMSWGRAADMAPGMPDDVTVTATSAIRPDLTITTGAPGRPIACHGCSSTYRNVGVATTATNVGWRAGRSAWAPPGRRDPAGVRTGISRPLNPEPAGHRRTGDRRPAGGRAYQRRCPGGRPLPTCCTEAL